MPRRKAKKLPWVPKLDFSQAPTVYAFWKDTTPTTVILGPVGSGKTFGCVTKVWHMATQQTPAPDGYKRFKAGIIRNTMPMLRRTTIETWLSVFPENKTGTMRHSSPMQHRITIPPRGWVPGVPESENPGVPGMDLIVDFFAMDTDEDKRALLSYECTMLYYNEFREIPKAIFDLGTTRVGRYPSEAKGGVMPSWYGQIADSNPPDEDHWLYHMDRVERPKGFNFHHQPPAVVEMEETAIGWQAKDIRYRHLIKIWDDESQIQRAAGRLWAVNPKAENLKFLPVQKNGDPLGAGGYYFDFIAGKSYDWIRSYAQGMYVFVQEGKPVIPEFNPDVHVADHVPILDGLPVVGGMDLGGTLNPACVFGQYDPDRNIYFVHDEVSVEEIGLKRFAGLLKPKIKMHFPNHEVGKFWGDPAGRQRDPIFEFVAFDFMMNEGFPVYAASSNDPQVRIEAIRQPLQRYHPETKTPGIIIHPRCRRLVKGLSGAWYYKRVQVSGEERYYESPIKNAFSHSCDALSYWLLGSGEIQEMRGRGRPGRIDTSRTYTANTDFDVLG